MNPSTSQTDTDFSHVSTSDPNETLILYVEPTTKKLKKYCESELKLVADLSTLELDELVEKPWFQDNSPLFDILLNDKSHLVMCIYPPGSGKSTNAEFLKYYLSKNGIPEKVRASLDACLFQKIEDMRAQKDLSYQKFRSCSSFVLLVDFNAVVGKIRSELEATYAEYMLNCWKRCGLPDEIINKESNLLLKDACCVWTSLIRLRDGIQRCFEGNLYVILDSLDNMYNLIANLPVADSQELYDQFTKGVGKLIYKNEPRIKTFIFGVSPYLITEFRKYAISCYFIGSEENSVGQFFSYSDASIERVINEWNLNINVDECKLFAKFEYNSNVFVNPYLCVSYLRSLKENGTLFRINLSPRSLWMKYIFEEEDLNILLEVLTGESKKKFGMAVSMHTMCTLSKDSKDRKLYYPLFVFGGFLSCRKETDGTYSLFASNDSSKILLRFHLDLLFLKKFRFPISECLSLFKEYLNGNFSLYCKSLSQCLRTMSSHLIKEERPYHSFMAGIIAPLILHGYTVEHDKEYGLIKPDSFITKDNRVILNEYKHVIPPAYIPKKARIIAGNLDVKSRCKKLEEFYADLENVAKSVIVKSCKEVVSQARLCQLSRYAPDFASKFQEDVEVNIILFYVNHVILLNCKYFYIKKSFSKYKIFSSEGYFEDEDLKSIQNAS